MSPRERSGLLRRMVGIATSREGRAVSAGLFLVEVSADPAELLNAVDRLPELPEAAVHELVTLVQGRGALAEAAATWLTLCRWRRIGALARTARGRGATDMTEAIGCAVSALGEAALSIDPAAPHVSARLWWAALEIVTRRDVVGPAGDRLGGVWSDRAAAIAAPDCDGSGWDRWWSVAGAVDWARAAELISERDAEVLGLVYDRPVRVSVRAAAIESGETVHGFESAHKRALARLRRAVRDQADDLRRALVNASCAESSGNGTAVMTARMCSAARQAAK